MKGVPRDLFGPRRQRSIVVQHAVAHRRRRPAVEQLQGLEPTGFIGVGACREEGECGGVAGFAESKLGVRTRRATGSGRSGRVIKSARRDRASGIGSS